MSIILPDGINDETNAALAKCIERAFNYDLSPLLVYLIDNVDESILPYLAAQFHVLGYEGWFLAQTDLEKRELIKNSIPLHKIKGTIPALERVLNILKLDGTIQEWFEYDGKPYHFKVSVTSSAKTFTTDIQQQLTNLINEYKNKRSILDSLDIMLPTDATVYVGCFGNIGEEIKINC